MRRLAIVCCAWFCGLVPLAYAGEADQIAVISGIRPPYQGFAFSSKVSSPERCVSLAMDLSAALGIRTHVLCVLESDGTITVAADCGFSRAKTNSPLETYAPGTYVDPPQPFLRCIPRTSTPFPATRVEPDLNPKPR